MSSLMVQDALDSLRLAHRQVLELSREGQTQSQIAARWSLVRSRIVSSDLAPRSGGCAGLLRVCRHDRDGSRAFVASVELPGPVWARRPR
jgi:hypothetical protein